MTANQLKKIREELGLTQAELADKLGVKTPTLVRYENGGRSVPTRIAFIVSNFKSHDQPKENKTDEIKLQEVQKPVVRTKFCAPLKSICSASMELVTARTKLLKIDDSQYTAAVEALDSIIAELNKIRASMHAKQNEVLKFIEEV